MSTTANSYSRRRIWHPRHGLGHWVSRGDVEAPPGAIGSDLLEFDGGHVEQVDWLEVAVGTPDWVRRARHAGKRVRPATPEESEWVTFTLNTGEVVAVRWNGSPEDAPPRDRGAQ